MLDSDFVKLWISNITLEIMQLYIWNNLLSVEMRCYLVHGICMLYVLVPSSTKYFLIRMFTRMQDAWDSYADSYSY